ncbi:trypsin-like serine peptidase [Ichthyenterobacterium magnum]|uniref:Trypsin n=1 Tax=Ichthyenterobacterium magnum TaxID=1230530 RepID=A0A420DKN1_9FLAO|nr:trypsin-like serine protease [Ichthyenterobacterium magnum]RKE94810.1 trypsin [Ichthyenterobacterium magnum]
MRIVITSLLLIVLMSNHLIAQNPKHKALDDFEFRFAKDYSSHKTDSIIQYNLLTKKEKILTFKTNAVTKSVKPSLGKYPPIDLKKYNYLPKMKNSQASLLFRTRDVVDNMKQFPITAVTKIVTFKDGKEAGGCTATFVNERFLITAAHCIKDPNGAYKDKAELKILFDNGHAEKTVDVKNAYYKKHYMEGTPFDANSYDIALVEIDEPLGKDLGYLGLLSQTEMDKRLNTWQTMYSFSYPHMSSAESNELKMEKEKNDSLKIKYKKTIQKTRLVTPDFNKRNQYFEVLNVFLDNQKNLKYTMPYSISGKSGSSRISKDYYLYGVRSVYYNGFETSKDVMVRNEILNSFIQIIQSKEN